MSATKDKTGIKNKEDTVGGMVASAVVDPLNLVGFAPVGKGYKLYSDFGDFVPKGLQKKQGGYIYGPRIVLKRRGVNKALEAKKIFQEQRKGDSLLPIADSHPSPGM